MISSRGFDELLEGLDDAPGAVGGISTGVSASMTVVWRRGRW